jgi:hypothetical protein
MTSNRDIERVLDHWFAEHPVDVADRVLDDVAGRISRERQRPAWRAPWRDAAMNPLVKVGAAIAAVVLIAVIGYNLLPASNTPVGGPGPTATPSSPASSPIALPDGRLEARDYIARAVAGDTMAFTITAPEGWSGFGGFFIGGPNTDPSGSPNGIGISFNHDPQVVADPCGPHDEDPTLADQSIDDLVTALSAREDLQVSGVTDTTLAGYSGKRLDLQFPAELACSNHYAFAEPKGLYANGPSNRWRVWLLDVDGSTAVVVLLDYAGTSAEDRAAAQAAIDSIRITP